MVASKKVVTFKAGKIMEERVEGKKGAAPAAVAAPVAAAPASPPASSGG
jgi:hypothetical protein